MKQSFKEKPINRHLFHEAGLKIQHDYHKLLFLAVRYGFRSPPHLELKARPKLGEREVTLVHVTEWIEKKLDQEFQVYTGRNKHRWNLILSHNKVYLLSICKFNC